MISQTSKMKTMKVNWYLFKVLGFKVACNTNYNFDAKFEGQKPDLRKVQYMGYNL